MSHPPVPIEQANQFLIFSSAKGCIGTLALECQMHVQQVVRDFTILTCKQAMIGVSRLQHYCKVLLLIGNLTTRLPFWLRSVKPL